MVAHTLHFDYELRSAVTAFVVADFEIKGEILDLVFRQLVSSRRPCDRASNHLAR
jgi:non-homologous end joining protein Ku